MPRFVKILMVAGTAAYVTLAALPAQEAAASSQETENSNLEIRRRFAELSRKVNETPELLKLKEDVEEAQRVYSEAFERALAKEDPEILAKYRGLFERSIRRLQAAKEIKSEPLEVSGRTLKFSEKESISQAREKALATPAVQAALQKWKNAATEAEKSTAEEEYEEVLKKATEEAGAEGKLGSADASAAGPEKPAR